MRGEMKWRAALLEICAVNKRRKGEKERKSQGSMAVDDTKRRANAIRRCAEGDCPMRSKYFTNILNLRKDLSHSHLLEFILIQFPIVQCRSH